MARAVWRRALNATSFFLRPPDLDVGGAPFRRGSSSLNGAIDAGLKRRRCRLQIGVELRQIAE
jgi:hypothetical protein